MLTLRMVLLALRECVAGVRSTCTAAWLAGGAVSGGHIRLPSTR